MLHPVPGVEAPTAADPADVVELLICVVGGMSVAVRVGVVLRILRMAALSPVPNPGAAVGMLNVAGEVFPVVDPRPALGMAAVRPHPSHYLLTLEDRSRYILWVDGVERIVQACAVPVVSLRDAPELEVAPLAAQLDGKVVPLLDTAALNPARRAPVDESRPGARTTRSGGDRHESIE
jgi:chemotaxis signal transduction protein